jgi:hypothetical protein
MLRLIAAAAASLAVSVPLAAQTVIGELNRGGLVEIEGAVTEVLGNRFVLRDATGAVLVTNGPSWHHKLDVRPGETLRVAGEPEDGEFDAFRIFRSNGDVIEIRPLDGPPPWAGGPDRDGD